LRIVIDIEANGLFNPTKIWVVVCKDIDTGEYKIFRNITDDARNLSDCLDYLRGCDLIIGHNYLGYDAIHLERLTGHPIVVGKILDTLIVSKVVDYPRSGHSIEDYGIEFGFEKIKFNDFSKYSEDMETYCIRDVDICHRIYNKYHRYISNPEHHRSIRMEHEFQLVCNQLHDNGFAFNKEKATGLLDKVTAELKGLDDQILEAFPPRLKLIREITPKETKHGTISLSSIPKALRQDIADMSVGAPFSYCSWSVFNPSSHSQIIRVLNEADWRPVEKTETHKETERSINQLKYKKKDPETTRALEDLEVKLKTLQKTGWKVNENNLETLPPSAPHATRLLAKRILLESRRRTLTEWLDLVTISGLKRREDGTDLGDARDVNPRVGTHFRIHGKFYGIGAWTHRMAHQAPNTANIPNEFDTANKKKLYGKELRALWCAPKNRLLVGVDAESIQLRIFAHYINDPEFTEALVNGKKELKTDPHNFNKSILGDVCKSRDAAKRYIFALLLGAGMGKLREILDCDEGSAREAYERLLKRYTGFATLKETIIPRDAKRGWFYGLDGRRVRILGDSEGGRRHLAMSGYLQNGEAVVMKLATLRWLPEVTKLGGRLVNLVHDEWQTEVPNNMEIALRVASLQADSLRIVGEELGLLCPLAGSYWDEKKANGRGDYNIATNWSMTH
jgi:DNA polymerase I